MIHLDSKYLSFLTDSGYGLRETLFYGLFSRLQIYKTRNEMLLALPCIHDGALSLDGGMIRGHLSKHCWRRNDRQTNERKSEEDVRIPTEVDTQGATQ